MVGVRRYVRFGRGHRWVLNPYLPVTLVFGVLAAFLAAKIGLPVCRDRPDYRLTKRASRLRTGSVAFAARRLNASSSSATTSSERRSHWNGAIRVRS